MKIVVNKCYGGFGLSPLAQKRYLELIGKECHFYDYFELSTDRDMLKKVHINANCLTMFTLTKDYGDTVLDENIDWDKDLFNDRQLKRDDKTLVKVVRELGVEAASGRFSKLKIINIPEGIDWEISEYDGFETIEEKHRSW